MRGGAACGPRAVPWLARCLGGGGGVRARVLFSHPSHKQREGCSGERAGVEAQGAGLAAALPALVSPRGKHVS